MAWWLYIVLIFAFLAAIRRIWPVYLNGIDSIFLTGDPSLRTSTIHAVMVTTKPVTIERLRRFIEGGFTHRRFKQRIVRRKWLWHYWTPDLSYSTENHMIITPSLPELDASSSVPILEQQHEALQVWISDLSMKALRVERPLWEFQLLEKYRGGSVLVFRIHHCMGDGIGLMRFAVAMMRKEMAADLLLEASSHAAVATAVAAPSPSPSTSSGAATIASSIPLTADTTTTTTTAAATATSAIATAGISTVPGTTDISASAAPAPATAKAGHHHHGGESKQGPTGGGGGGGKREKKKKLSVLETVRKGLSATLKMLLLPDDPVSPLKHATTLTDKIRTNARWSRVPISLALLKRIAAHRGGSVNDVIFAILAGAFGHYLTKHNLPLPKRSIQSVLWVSLRGTSIDGPPSFGNNLGAVYLKLPVQEPDATKRIQLVRQETAELISSPEPFLSSFFLSMFGLLPEAISYWIWITTAFKVTTSVSNLPGSTTPLAIAGAPLSQFVFFVPPARTLGHFCTVLSYNGEVTFGFSCDERLIPDPNELVALCHEEINALAAEAPPLPLKSLSSSSSSSSSPVASA